METLFFSLGRQSAALTQGQQLAGHRDRWLKYCQITAFVKPQR